MLTHDRLRCDRQQPCSTCSSRGLQCSYPDKFANAQTEVQPGAAALRDRIAQLERLVMSMRPDSLHKAGVENDVGRSSDHDPADAVTSPVQISLSKHEYVGGDHWVTIMNSIADLKQHFDWQALEQSMSDDGSPTDPTDDNDSQPFVNSHALLLFGTRPSSSRADLIRALPSKSVVDRYISRYFNFQDLVACQYDQPRAKHEPLVDLSFDIGTIHGPTFVREYESFWVDPDSAPTMWISLLFSIICLAVLSTNGPGKHGEIAAHFLEIESYRARTVDGLILGEYTRPGPYVLESMINYLYIEYGRYSDAHQDIWHVLALVVNIATRMGYHRDPTHFPHISSLQGEMRRRIWATVVSIDILISNQMGMPRLIGDWKSDTREPRNLNDADINALTSELPPSRPETDLTSTLSLIARRRVLKAFGSILDLNAGIRPANYADVMRHDLALDEAAAAVPPPLQMKPMCLSITDAPQLVMSRVFISFLFHKGKLILHCPFLTTDSPTFEHSRRACLSSALDMLRLHQFLDEETQPGGQLSMMRWRVSSIINHHSLTATMILCFFVHHGWMHDQRAKIFDALQGVSAIWTRNSSSSNEARRAAETIGVVLKDLGQACATSFIPSDLVRGQSVTANTSEPSPVDMFSGTPDFSWATSAWSPNDLFDHQVSSCASSVCKVTDNSATPYDQPMNSGSALSGPSNTSLNDWMAQFLAASHQL